jgi:hypothetical protein
VLGVVNFPTFYKAMDSAQHIVTLGADGTLSAVELVDRTMIELARAEPRLCAHGAHRPVSEDQPGQARRHPAGRVLGGLQGQTSRQKSGNWSNSWATSACPAASWK